MGLHGNSWIFGTTWDVMELYVNYWVLGTTKDVT